MSLHGHVGGAYLCPWFLRGPHKIPNVHESLQFNNYYLHPPADVPTAPNRFPAATNVEISRACFMYLIVKRISVDRYLAPEEAHRAIDRGGSRSFRPDESDHRRRRFTDP